MDDFIERWEKEIYGSPEWDVIVEDYLEMDGFKSMQEWGENSGFIYDPVSDLWFDEHNSSIDINREFLDYVIMMEALFNTHKSEE